MRTVLLLLTMSGILPFITWSCDSSSNATELDIDDKKLQQLWSYTTRCRSMPFCSAAYDYRFQMSSEDFEELPVELQQRHKKTLKKIHGGRLMLVTPHNKPQAPQVKTSGELLNWFSETILPRLEKDSLFSKTEPEIKKDSILYHNIEVPGQVITMRIFSVDVHEQPVLAYFLWSYRFAESDETSIGLDNEEGLSATPDKNYFTTREVAALIKNIEQWSLKSLGLKLGITDTNTETLKL